MQPQQKLVVTYRRDESLHQLVLGNIQPQGFNIQTTIKFQNAILGKRGIKNRNGKNLKQIFLKSKVKQLTQNFIRKLRRNSTRRAPLENLQDHINNFQNTNSIYNKFFQKISKISKTQGLVLDNWVLVFWNGFSTLQFLVLAFIFSIFTAFLEIEILFIFTYIRIFIIFFFGLDILLNFTVQRYENGKKLTTVGQITNYYLRNGFIIDLISIILFPIAIFSLDQVVNLIATFVSIIKFFSSVHKFQRYQYLIITSNEKEQYFGLIKVLFTNFLIGHFLSVILNLMPALNYVENWHIKMGIAHQAWYIKYIWGYYWGTNIMLTVGFGDLTATNYTEAIILVFIQTFSCITLAYNISYVGALIGSIRSNQQSKKKKLKTFYRMCKQNQVSHEIESKISNFIQQSYQIKQNFQHDAREEVIQFLPKQMQRQYRKQANKILFDSLGFLNNLSKKSLLTLAQEVNCRICHPEQIIFKKNNVSDFCILQKGCLAMTCKTRSNLDDKIIQCLSVKNKQKPKILSLDFIKNRRITYNIKSLNYSVLYYLNRENFMQALKGSQMDYQLFCVLKDKDQYIIDQNNLYSCKNCKNEYHNKFQCTRLHYIPIKQNVIIRYLNRSGHHTQSRRKFMRQKDMIDAIFLQRQLLQCQQRFINDNYDAQHYKQIQQLIKFYQKNLSLTKIDGPNDQQYTLTQQGTINQKSLNNPCTNRMLNEKNIRSNKKQKRLSIGKQEQKKKKRRNMLTGQINMKNFIEQKAIYKLEQLIQKQACKKQNHFWDFQIDQACDFRYYFKQGNPQNLNRMKKRRYKNLFQSINQANKSL